MSTERANDRVITVHAPFLVLAIARNQKSLSNMAINCVGRKFENILLTSLKESLALFPVNELKAEQRLITEKIVARRDVFGHELPKGYGKILTFQLLPCVFFKLLEGLRLRVSANPLVVVISPRRDSKNKKVRAL